MKIGWNYDGVRQSMASSRRGGVAAFSLLIVGFVWSALAPMMASDGVTNTEPWLSALTAVQDELKPGDTILVHPPWRDDVLDVLASPATTHVRHRRRWTQATSLQRLLVCRLRETGARTPQQCR